VRVKEEESDLVKRACTKTFGGILRSNVKNKQCYLNNQKSTIIQP